MAERLPDAPDDLASSSVVRVGLAMATSIRVRMEVSGVDPSTCEALATNRRWLAKATSRRSSMSSKVSASSLSSYARPVEADPLMKISLRGKARRPGDLVEQQYVYLLAQSYCSGGSTV